MASIEEVIARSRLGGNFKERRTFTLARHRAIRKLREFALADPHYYCLELIQAAVANGARMISLEFGEDEVLFSYVGGGLAAGDLAHLFDFLFASKDRLEVGHLRELALGINALLLFEPETVVLESGDGLPGGTTRMVVHGRSDSVDIGSVNEPLNGTYLRASGVKRSRVSGRSLFRFVKDLPAEARAIEERCLTAPVPILVNGEAPFGYRTMRIPQLWGYQPTSTFDEDELYGTVGVHMFNSQPTFRLLTYGVWIQTVEKEFGSGRRIGGVINFDRLRKTADHSAIVQDEICEEMWIRVRPYVMKLTGKERRGTLHDVRLLSGGAIAPKEIRALLCDHRYVVAITRRQERREGRPERARAIGHALEAPVLVVPGRHIETLRQLGGRQTGIVTPQLATDEEVDFYRLPPACSPPEPWLASCQPIEPCSVSELAAAIADEGAGSVYPSRPTGTATAITDVLGTAGRVTASLFAPEDSGDAGAGIWARVLVADRVAWQGRLAGAYPGQWLDVRAPDVSPLVVRGGIALPGQSDVPLGELIATAMLKRGAADQAALEQRALRSLASLGDQMGDAARRLALRVMARNGVLRYRAAGDVPGVRIALLGEPDALLDLPVMRTIGGKSVSVADLVAGLERTGGLIYGVIPEVEPDLTGLDVGDILSIEQCDERMLVMLFGDAAYVRVDRRDLLAEHRRVRCRDLALGLRDYPVFPLLVEGEDPTAWQPEEQRQCLAALLEQLTDYYVGRRPTQPEDPAEFPAWEENRRHACRHLQYFVLSSLLDDPHADLMGVERLPLFLGPDGEPYDVGAVYAALRRPQGLVIQYREGLGRTELARLSQAAALGRRGEREPPRALAVSPFVASLLGRLGRLRFALDFDLSDREAAENPQTPEIAFMASRDIHGDFFSGTVGVPAGDGVEPAIILLDESGRQLTALDQEAHTSGVVGFVKLRGSPLADAGTIMSSARHDLLAGAIERGAAEVIHDMIERLATPAVSAAQRVRMERAILDYGARHLNLLANPNGVVVPMVLRPAAQAALDLPLFATGDGEAVTGWRLVSEFCALGSAAKHSQRTALRRVLEAREPGLPGHLRTWLEATLSESRVSRLSSAATRRQVPRAIWPERERAGSDVLAQNLTYWLERLRPDDDLVTATGERLTTRVMIETPLDEPDAKYPWMVTGGALAEYHERSDPGTGRRVHGSWLCLSHEHWLVERALASMPEPDELAWLLFACYAKINERREPVTNEHEQVFQTRIADALERGELCYVQALSDT